MSRGRKKRVDVSGWQRLREQVALTLLASLINEIRALLGVFNTLGDNT